jgi:CheY-like chemotaxis protein
MAPPPSGPESPRLPAGPAFCNGVELSVAEQAKLAHDIRNPLTIVTTNLDFALAELEAGRSGGELRTALREARDAAERLSIIAEGLGRRPHETDQQSVASAAPGFVAPRRASGTRARMARILVVDDEPALGAALRRTLRDYDVVVTLSGQEALARIVDGERFDFILCDLTMPAMGGDELYREIQRIAPDQALRIVFITGGATTEKARTFLENVPNPIIYKPYDVTELREMIRTGLASAPRPAPITSSRP